MSRARRFIITIAAVGIRVKLPVCNVSKQGPSSMVLAETKKIAGRSPMGDCLRYRYENRKAYVNLNTDDILERINIHSSYLLTM